MFSSKFVKALLPFLMSMFLISMLFLGCDENPCRFVLYADEEYGLSSKSPLKALFDLPNDIPHLPLSRGEDFPMAYWIHADVPEGLRDPLLRVFEDWNTQIEFQAFVFSGIDDHPVDPIDNRRDGKNVVYWLNIDQITDTITTYDSTISNFDFSKIDGVTFPMTTKDHINEATSFVKIFDADILINRESFSLLSDIFRHELGHALGLSENNIFSMFSDTPLMFGYQIPQNRRVDYVDPHALHSLSCTYDLEALRQAFPFQ